MHSRIFESFCIQPFLIQEEIEMLNLRRNYLFHLKMNDLEKEALERLATIEGRNPSDAMREALRRFAQERGAWPVTQTTSQSTNEQS